jgi:hypothetical protein
MRKLKNKLKNDLKKEILCHGCGLVFFCSIECARVSFFEHPCDLMYQVQCVELNGAHGAHDETNLIHTLQQLPWEMRNIMGLLYTIPLSQKSIEILILGRISGSGPGWNHCSAFDCLFQIAAVVDIWPHMAFERRLWIEKMAPALAFFQPHFVSPLYQSPFPNPSLKDWSSAPLQYIPLLRPFVCFGPNTLSPHTILQNATLLLSFFQHEHLWKYIFADEEAYVFLTLLLRTVSPQCQNNKSETSILVKSLESALKNIKIGRGLTLAVFGRYIHLPLICSSYELAKTAARFLKTPPGMYFVFDRQSWLKARSIYLIWLHRRDTLFALCSAGESVEDNTVGVKSAHLSNLLDYTWLGL